MIKLGYQIPVLMYHRFIKKNEKIEYPWSINEELFEKQMKYLNENGYKFIFLSELENIDIENLKEKYIILTSDDGYMDNYELMFPILKKYNIKMNVFLISGKKYNSWDCEENTSRYPKAYLLEAPQIKIMQSSGLIEFGLHGKNHKYLPKISKQELYEEIITAKKELEENFEISITTMAYPHGGYNENVREIVEKSEIKFACATEWGSYKINDDFLTIRRINIGNNDNLWKFKIKTSGYYNLIRVKMEEIKKILFKNFKKN